MRPPNYRPPIDPIRVRSLAWRLVLIAFLLAAAFQSISFYVDSLWFESLGFEAVYWYRLKAQGLVFLAFGVVSAVVLYVVFRLVMPSIGYSRRPFLEIGGEAIVIPTVEALKRLTLPVAVVLGFFFGLTFSSDWNTYTLFVNRVSTPNVSDPIFRQPISFYLFTLPILENAATWFLSICVIGLLAAVLLSVIDMTAAFRGVSLGLSLVLFAMAAQTYVGRYALILAENNLFTGIRYVDDNIVVPGLWFVIAALIMGAGVAAANIRLARIRNIGVAVAIPALTYVVAGILAPGYVTNFVVRPNELVRETPYIKNTIEFTRKAFALDRIEEVPFEPRLSNVVFDPAAHADTLDNVRLWDWRALQATLRQIQEIRSYYDFPDIDVDRYMIDGKMQAMMLAVRELSLNKLAAGSKNWVNERLIYTHGYGITMNPVSRFTKEGLPEFVLSNMPVESTQKDIRVTRPEIYFGEITDWPVYVKTGQKEFNYPEGDANNYNTYEGTGGIRMGSFFRRLLLAWTVGDITKVPFSDDVKADSMLLMRRNIRERVSELAPFLTFDDDPYIVVGADGGLYWIVDAFTTSDRYPYARHINFRNRPLNYIRNSVKAVIDAYNGTVHFYVFDQEDPLIQSYQKMFPSLFLSVNEMPDFLRPHVRYPELLFRAQAAIYSTYHVENEQVFYNREDVWTVAQQGRTQQGPQAADAIEPFFILMRFPGSKELEFVSILPFTPANRNNLIGWLGGRSDGDKYGTLRAYRFPKTRFVDGPLQIQARIDQDPQLSSQLTLWNQQGSTVIRGNLLVIPLDDVLLFVEPMYLQAERSPMPELRLVVLATQDRLAYAPRFAEALSQLLAGRITAPAAAPSADPEHVTTKNESPDLQSLVRRANQAFADYQRLTAEGKLGEAGVKLDELKQTLQELNRQGLK
ncbi:MAG TPA: UPF0182 family protein [Terriglobia bacterium]|nr:UPF0182 family protein [Terriglobia bacterium]